VPLVVSSLAFTALTGHVSAAAQHRDPGDPRTDAGKHPWRRGTAAVTLD
jgi:hypothetical protein